MRQQRRFHPVLATNGGAGADDDTGGIFFHRRHKRRQVFPRRVGADGDHAVIGADAGQPAHIIHAVAAKLALRQVEQRAAGERDYGTGFAGALGDDRVVGHSAYAAGHVGDAHRFFDGAGFHQADLDQLAGEVEAAAGLGGRDTFGTGRRLGGQGRGG